jgi:hypothetical protein
MNIARVTQSIARQHIRGQQRVVQRAFSTGATSQSDVQAAAAAVLMHLDREAIAWTIEGKLDGAIQHSNQDFVVTGVGEDGTAKLAVSVTDEDFGFEEKYTMTVGGESVTVEDINYATAMSPALEVRITTVINLRQALSCVFYFYRPQSQARH